MVLLASSTLQVSSRGFASRPGEALPVHPLPLHLQPPTALALAKKSFWRSWQLSERWGLIQREASKAIRGQGRPKISSLKMRPFGGNLWGNQLPQDRVRPRFAVRIH